MASTPISHHIHARDKSSPRFGYDVASTPPRHRMRGGDLPQGGQPLGLGHAGRMRHGLMSAVALVSLFATYFAGMAMPFFSRTAYADEIIYLANDGSATRRDDGTVVGQCEVTAIWLGDQMTTFTITMPDGQSLDAECIAYESMVPADGSYPFTATPEEDGKYSVLAHSSGATHYQLSDKVPVAANGASIQDVATQDGVLWVPKTAQPKGKLVVEKSSYDSTLTTNNLAYSLKNARYGVYRNEDCKTSDRMDPSYDLVTNGDGISNTIELDPGTYWIKEEQAPRGYLLDEKAYEVTIALNTTTTSVTTLKIKDRAIYDSAQIWANKRDTLLGSTLGAQGSATLQGSQITVNYYDGLYERDSLPAVPRRSWVIESDEHGVFVPSERSKVDGSAFFTYNNKIIIPYGTITIQETKAPNGYLLEGQLPSSPTNYSAPLHVFHINNKNAYVPIAIRDDVMRGGIKLQKVDQELDVLDGGNVEETSRAQGDASLANAVFSIRLESEQPVVVDGTTYHKGDVVKTIGTDDTGYAATGARDLPLGTYTIYESEAPVGYLLNERFSLEFTLEEDGAIVDLCDDACEEHVMRGGLSINKVSRETSASKPQGSASLEGAHFIATLMGNQPIVIGDTCFKPGDTVVELETNELGYCCTDTNKLPYGTYEITEVEPPEGYLLNEDWKEVVEVREDGVLSTLSAGSEMADQVVRGDFHFLKVSERTMEHMSGIPFLITSATTGESHLVVSDENGLVSTSAFPHSTATNANDNALGAEKSIQENALDPNAGVWFGGLADTSVEPNDEFGALPYDTYHVEELPCNKNKRYMLVSFDVTISEHGEDIDLGTISNRHVPDPSLGTVLTFDKDKHVAPVGRNVKLTDYVSYANLDTDTGYILEARLMDKSTLSSEETPKPIASQSIPLAPSNTSGTVEVVFDIDTSSLEGKTLVCYEALREESTRDIVARHEEPNDESQTVHIPSLQTSFGDADGKREIEAKDTVTLVDTVSYRNLVPHRTYEVYGTLVDKETKKTLTNADGSEVHATATVIPKQADGTTTVTFTVQGNVVANKRIVAFEQLKHDGIALVAHENINDAQQTVTVGALKKEKDNKETKTSAQSTSGTTSTSAQKTTDVKEETQDTPKGEKTATPNTSDASLSPLVVLLVGAAFLILALPQRR